MASVGKDNLRIAAKGLLALALTVCCGCQPFDHYHAPASAPIPSLTAPPTEKDRMSLPAYRIEPPDLIQLDALKLVPLPPYHLESYDVIQIEVLGTLLDQPIRGYYLIEAEGTINLGAAYGTLRVVGFTIEQARSAITTHLKTILAQPEVSVTLARVSSSESISGTYLVATDGTIRLGQHGVVHIAGKTLVEVRTAIESHLSLYFDSPQVSVDMVGFNSKVYYIVTEGAGLGDNTVRLPITGNETVLDALAEIGGISALSSKSMFIARPGPGQLGCQQVLPVDWNAVAHGATATNYQLLPGDRLYIVEDEVVASDNLLAKFIRPVEHLLGVTGVGTNAIRGTQTLGRSYNRTRN